MLALPLLLLRREAESAPRTSARQGADVYAFSFVVPARLPQTSAHLSTWAMGGQAQLGAVGNAALPYLCLILFVISGKYGKVNGLVVHAGVWVSSASSTLRAQTSAWLQHEPALVALNKVEVYVS
jgi:hypothetical protein